MLMGRVRINVPPYGSNGGRDTITKYLGVACMNAKFLSLLDGRKNLRLTRHYNPWEQFNEDYVEPEWLRPYSVIQDMFWSMTDGAGLTEDDLEELLKALKK